MYKIIALIGESGSGKDTVMQRVLAACPELHEIISCTTRPRREHEIEGVNYFYLTPEQFADKVINNEMLEATNFNSWFYGTSYDSLRSDCINIGVFNPAGIESIILSPNVQVLVFYIKAKGKERLLRQLSRENDPDVSEIIRRYKADTEDFFDLDFPYTELPNNTQEDLEKAVENVITAVHKVKMG